MAPARGQGPLTDRLQTAYIELSEQVGWMCFDARRHPQAQRIHHTGMRLAHETATSLTSRHASANLWGRLVLAVELPEDEDVCREGHLLRSLSVLGLGSAGVLESPSYTMPDQQKSMDHVRLGYGF
ncbi:hypothetical protein [Streptomyces sp. SAJ15]|uniref:hypothetical protein n=1 Tax=Streptomyces sp. SAJ15 TaxID=2011095 RepID=UPI001642CA19|nr:hypothetical protein [Streptomyces sp. SAJ15]